VAIINVVFLFMTTDLNGNVVAGDHRQLAKRTSHAVALFIFDYLEVINGREDGVDY
jgi:hypothetical protein